MFEWENNHEELLNWVGTLANSIHQDSIRSDREGAFVKKQVQFLQESGFTRLTVPTEFGGNGVDLATMMLALERLAEADASTALVMGWHLGIIYALRITGAWSDDDFYELCEKTIKGEALINACATEPATGSPSRGGVPVTKATKLEGGYVIQGEKTWATGSPMLSHILITAYLPEEDQIGEFLVRRGTPGMRHVKSLDSMAMRGSGSDTLVFEDMHLPFDALVDQFPPKGHSKRSAYGGGWLLHIPAVYMGIAKAARDYVLEFTSTYQPNSLQAPISSLASVRQQLGKIEALLIPARHFLYNVAIRYDQLPLDERDSLKNEIQLAKHTVTNTAVEIVDLAMRIAGGHSLLRHAPLERYYRDVRAGLHNPPMDDVTILGLADRALKRVLHHVAPHNG